MRPLVDAGDGGFVLTTHEGLARAMQEAVEAEMMDDKGKLDIKSARPVVAFLNVQAQAIPCTTTQLCCSHKSDGEQDVSKHEGLPHCCTIS